MATIKNYGKSWYSIAADIELESVCTEVDVALKVVDPKFSASTTTAWVTDGIAISYDGTKLGECGWISGVTYAERIFRWATNGTNIFSKSFSANADYCLGLVATSKAVALVDFSAAAGGIATAAVIITLDDTNAPLIMCNKMGSGNNTFQEDEVYTENAEGDYSYLTATVTHTFSNSASAFPPAVYNKQAYAKNVYWMLCNPLQNGVYSHATLGGASYYALGSFLLAE